MISVLPEGGFGAAEIAPKSFSTSLPYQAQLVALNAEPIEPYAVP
jgi:hypothetical protein